MMCGNQAQQLLEFQYSKIPFFILRYFNLMHVVATRHSSFLNSNIPIFLFSSSDISADMPVVATRLQASEFPGKSFFYFQISQPICQCDDNHAQQLLELQQCVHDCDIAAAGPKACSGCTTCDGASRCSPTACNSPKCSTHELMLRCATIVRVGCDASASPHDERTRQRKKGAKL